MIPNKVKVAGITYEIKEKEHVFIDGSANYAGSCDYDNAIIEVKVSLPTERKEETFIHELTHAIFNEAGFDNQDEDVINRVSKVLYQVLKDNPLLVQERK